MVSVCQIANPLNAMDAQTWVVGDGDLPLVEHRAAQDGVLAAQHGAVQVDLDDDLQARWTAALTLILASSMQPIMHSTP